MTQQEPPAEEHWLIQLFNKTNFVKNNPVELRAFVKWCFDLLRNLMIVGVLLFLGVKTNNLLLKGASGILLALIFYYLWSYIDAMIWSPINFPRYPRASKYGGFVLNVALFISAWILGLYYLQVFIFSITNAYLQK